MQNPALHLSDSSKDMTQMPLRSGERPETGRSDRHEFEVKARQCSSFGDALLRDYQMHLDPLNTSERTSMGEEDTKEPMSSISNASTQVNDSPLEFPIPPQKTGTSFLGQRKGTGPPSHKNMLSALASRPSKETTHQESSLSASMSGLGSNPRASFATRFAQSPCFFHQRFDDAVNIERVLEEISAEDDGMSHSRLMQTATSVREISKQLQRRPIKRAVRTIMIVTKARDNKLVSLEPFLNLQLHAMSYGTGRRDRERAFASFVLLSRFT